jgi:hypothetical protein
MGYMFGLAILVSVVRFLFGRQGYLFKTPTGKVGVFVYRIVFCPRRPEFQIGPNWILIDAMHRKYPHCPKKHQNILRTKVFYRALCGADGC